MAPVGAVDILTRWAPSSFVYEPRPTDRAKPGVPPKMGYGPGAARPEAYEIGSRPQARPTPTGSVTMTLGGIWSSADL